MKAVYKVPNPQAICGACHSGGQVNSQGMFNVLKGLSLLLVAFNPAARHQLLGVCHGQSKQGRALGVSMLLKDEGESRDQEADWSSEGPSAVPAARTPQVIRLRDNVTKQEIRIVGAIHNNPASIALSMNEVALAYRQYNGKLGALVVESCQSRWNRSFEDFPPGSLIARLTPSETQSAASAAQKRDVPIMLGDTDIETLNDRLTKATKQYIIDLLNPFFGGWRSTIRDLRRTVKSNFDTSDIAESKLLLDGEAPISELDFAQPEVLLGFLSTFLRYPLVVMLQAPMVYIVFALLWYVLSSSTISLEDSYAEFMSASDTISDAIIESDAFSILRLKAGIFWNVGVFLNVLLLRIYLVAIVEERNAHIARSIRRAAAERKAPVVAILGSVHANGVARLLMSEDSPDADGLDSDGVWWEPPPDMDIEKWL